MVMDFDEIKHTIQLWIDTTLDHKMLFRKDDRIAKVLQKRGERCFLMDVNPTAEAIAKLIFDYAKRRALPVTAVKLWETEQSFATYRPS